MAREIVIQSWCDPCLSQDRRVSAVLSPVLSVNGGPGRRLDVCGEHAEPLLAALGLLDQFGVAPEEDPAEKSYVCPVCGTSHASRKAMLLHARKMHQMRAKEVDQAGGEAGIFVCPECELKAESAAGLGAHRRAKHRVNGTSAASIKARSQSQENASGVVS